MEKLAPAIHPGRLLRREMEALKLSANRLAINLGVPSGRVTDILNSRRSITADTALRLALYFGNTAQFWLDLQSQYDIAIVEREHGAEIKKRVHLADAA
jgi:antitoxin HigA-1